MGVYPSAYSTPVCYDYLSGDWLRVIIHIRIEDSFLSDDSNLKLAVMFKDSLNQSKYIFSAITGFA